MKFVGRIVFLTCLCLVPGILVYAENNVSPKPITFADATPLGKERAQWYFVQHVITVALEQQQSSVQRLGSMMHQHPVLATAVGVPTVSLLFGLLLEKNTMLDGYELMSSAAALGVSGYCIAQKIVDGLGVLIEQWPATCLGALNSFLATWSVNRPDMPEMLYSTFDHLANDYQEHGGRITVSAQQARVIVECLLSTSVLAQQVVTLFAQHQAKSVIGNMFTAIKKYIASLIMGIFMFQMDVADLMSSKDSSDSRSERSKWEYVAQRLGVIGAEGASLASFIKRFELPLTFGIGIPAGFVGGFFVAKSMCDQADSDILMAGRIIGSAAGIVVMSVLCRALSGDSKDKDNERALLAFIKDWKTHQLQTPTQLVPLFDELYSLYTKNGNALHLEASFVYEVHRIIAMTWFRISES